MSRNLTLVLTTFFIIPISTILAQIPSPQTFTDPNLGIEFVLIKGGCYMMGDVFGDGDPDEQPAHKVCLDDFYLARYELTQGQWKKVMNSNPAHNKKGDNYPVEVVTKWQVDDFLKQLNNKSKTSYRLPTEAEWEYACRSGGKKLRFGTDNNKVTPNNANQEGSGDGFEKSAPVGSFSPNGLGLYDMSGNVSEWTSDWYDREYYTYSPVNNPKGAKSSDARYFARRGGSWYNKTRFLRCSIRNWRDPGFKLVDLGFRLARDID